ncbi:MAG: hypothetical protein ACYC56_09070 [Candidatus Aquicultor sp.]
MENVKCTSNNHECSENLDICCQFCLRNYSPCTGKCSGCWDEAKENGYVVEPRVAAKPIARAVRKPDLPAPVA